MSSKDYRIKQVQLYDDGILDALQGTLKKYHAAIFELTNFIGLGGSLTKPFDIT